MPFLLNDLLRHPPVRLPESEYGQQCCPELRSDQREEDQVRRGICHDQLWMQNKYLQYHRIKLQGL